MLRLSLIQNPKSQSLRTGSFAFAAQTSTIFRAGACLLLGAATLVCGACAATKPLLPPQASPVIVPTAKRAESAHPASLWVDAGQNRWSLIRDDKALDVGDIVTVIVSNNTSASGEAKTATSRDSSIQADITNLFGWETMIPRTVAPVGAAAAPLIATSSESSFEGDASTERTGKISGRITCQVSEVQANGNMRIIGSEAVIINNERTILTLDGLVRPSDISIDNTVSSSKVADARIEYTGRGPVADVQRPGWGMRIYNWVWPF